MKKLVLLAALFVVVVASLVAALPVMAAKIDNPANNRSGGVGNSNVAFLYLYEKDPANWSIVPDGAWGKLKFNLAGPTFDYVFNGHKLMAGTDYSLIYYADPWPGNHPGALIASGAADAGGNIHLASSVDLDTNLPNAADANYPTGAKIWLVLSSDYDATTHGMTAWNPTKYLFEHNLITYTDTNLP